MPGTLLKRFLRLHLVLLLAAGLAVTGCSRRTGEGYTGPTARYVFLFIGDGMGLAQVTAAESFLKLTRRDTLGFTQFPICVQMTTHSGNSLVTGSASAATAMATGHKTRNGRVGMDAAAETSYTSISDLAKDAGLKAGIVTSVSLDHATPAGFYAHQRNRNMYYRIGRDLINSGIDYAGGGGFVMRTKRGEPDLLDLAREKGINVVTDRQGFRALRPDGRRVFAVNQVLTYKQAMPYEIDRAKDDLTLADYTRQGTALLENKKGFFMMIEAGKIDWACHTNDAGAVVYGVLALNQAVRVALEFMERYPRETLILVTADHETGGLGLTGREAGLGAIGRLANQKCSGDVFLRSLHNYRTATPAARARIRDILPRIKESYGLVKLEPGEEKELEKQAAKGNWRARNKLNKSLRSDDLAQLEEALQTSIAETEEQRRTRSSIFRRRYGTYDTFLVTLNRLASRKIGLGWTTYSHTGIPVPVYARGAGAELFGGKYDNTDLFRKLKAVMKL